MNFLEFLVWLALIGLVILGAYLIMLKRAVVGTALIVISSLLFLMMIYIQSMGRV